MYCEHCGKDLPVDAKFCSNCGTAVKYTLAESGDSPKQLRFSRNLQGDHTAQDPQRVTSPNIPFVSAQKTATTDSRMSVREKMTGTASYKTGKSKKAWIIAIIAVGLVLTSILAVVLLDGALIPSGSYGYRYFGTLAELITEEPDIISRVYHENLTITCSDYKITEYEGMTDSISNSTHYASGLTEGDRFMETDILITRKSDGWDFYFENYRDVYRWMSP